MRDLVDARTFLRELEVGLRAKLSNRPALLMYGQFDPTRFMGWMRRFARIFPDNRRRVVPLEGHFPHEGSPVWMIREMREWLHATDAAASRP